MQPVQAGQSAADGLRQSAAQPGRTPSRARRSDRAAGTTKATAARPGSSFLDKDVTAAAVHSSHLGALKKSAEASKQRLHRMHMAPSHLGLQDQLISSLHNAEVRLAREGSFTGARRSDGSSRVAQRSAQPHALSDSQSTLPRVPSSASSAWGGRELSGVFPTAFGGRHTGNATAGEPHSLPQLPQGAATQASRTPTAAAGATQQQHPLTIGRIPYTAGQGLPQQTSLTRGGDGGAHAAPHTPAGAHGPGQRPATAGSSPGQGSPSSARSGVSRPSTAVSISASTAAPRWPWLEETDFFAPGQAAALLGAATPGARAVNASRSMSSSSRGDRSPSPTGGGGESTPHRLGQGGWGTLSTSAGQSDMSIGSAHAGGTLRSASRQSALPVGLSSSSAASQNGSRRNREGKAEGEATDQAQLPDEELAINHNLLTAAKRSQRKLSAALLMASKHTFRRSLQNRAGAAALSLSASAPTLGGPTGVAGQRDPALVVQLSDSKADRGKAHAGTASQPEKQRPRVAWEDPPPKLTKQERERRRLETAVLSGINKRKGGSSNNEGPRRNVSDDTIAARALRRQATEKRKLQASKSKRKPGVESTAPPQSTTEGGAKPQWYRPLQDLLSDSKDGKPVQQHVLGAWGGDAISGAPRRTKLRRRRPRGQRVAVRASDSTLGRGEVYAPQEVKGGGVPRLMTAPAASSSSPSHGMFGGGSHEKISPSRGAHTAASPAHTPSAAGGGGGTSSLPAPAAAMRVHWSPTLHAPNQGLQSELNLDPVKASMRAIAMGHGGVKRLDASLKKVLRSTTAVQADGQEAPLDVLDLGADTPSSSAPEGREPGSAPPYTPLQRGGSVGGFAPGPNPARSQSPLRGKSSAHEGGSTRSTSGWGAVAASVGGGRRSGTAGSRRSSASHDSSDRNMRGTALFAVASTQFRSRDDYPRLALSASSGWRPSPLVPEQVQYDTPRQVRETNEAIARDKQRRGSSTSAGRDLDGFAADSAVQPWGFGRGGEARSETPLDQSRRHRGRDSNEVEAQLQAASPRSDASARSNDSAWTRGTQETAVVMEHLDELLQSQGQGHSSIPTPRQRGDTAMPQELQQATARSASVSKAAKGGRRGVSGPMTPIQRRKGSKGARMAASSSVPTLHRSGSTSQMGGSQRGLATSGSSAAHFRLRSVVQASRQRQRERQLTHEDAMEAQNSAGEYLQILTAISSTAALRPSSVPAVVALHRARVRAALAKQRAHAHALKRAKDKIAAEAAMKAAAEELAATPLDPVDTVQLKGEERSVANERAATAARLARGEECDQDALAGELAAEVKRTQAQLDAAEGQVAHLKRRKAFKPLPGPFPSRRGEAYRPQLLTEGDRRAFGLWASGLDDFVSDRQGMPRPGKGVSLRASADTRVAWMLDMARADDKVAARLAQRVASYKLANMQDIGLKGTLGTDGLSAVTRNTLSSSLRRERPEEKRAAVAGMAEQLRERASSASQRRREVRQQQLQAIEHASTRTQRLQERRVQNERVMTWVYLLKLTKSVQLWEKALLHDRLLRPSSVLGNAAALVMQRHWRGFNARRWVQRLQSVRPILGRLVTQWRIRRRARRVRDAATLLQDFICSHVLNLGAGGFAWQSYMKAYLRRVRLVQRVVRDWLACRHARMVALGLWWEHLCLAEAEEADKQRKRAAAKVAYAAEQEDAGETGALHRAQSTFTDASESVQAAACQLYLAKCSQRYSRARRQWVKQHLDLWRQLQTSAPGVRGVTPLRSPPPHPEAFKLGDSPSSKSALSNPSQAQETTPRTTGDGPSAENQAAARAVVPSSNAGATGMSFAQLTVQAAFSGAAAGAGGGNADREDEAVSPGHALGAAAMSRASSALSGGVIKLDDAGLASMTPMPPHKRKAFLARLAFGDPEQVSALPKTDRDALRWVGPETQARIVDMQSYRGGMLTNAPWQALLQTVIPSGTDEELQERLQANARLAASVQAHSPASRASPTRASASGAASVSSAVKGGKGGKSRKPGKLTRQSSKKASIGKGSGKKKRGAASKRGELTLPTAEGTSGQPSPLMTPGSRLESSIMAKAAERAAASAQQWAGRPPVLHVFCPAAERRLVLLEAIAEAKSRLDMRMLLGGTGGGYSL